MKKLINVYDCNIPTTARKLGIDGEFDVSEICVKEEVIWVLRRDKWFKYPNLTEDMVMNAVIYWDAPATKKEPKPCEGCGSFNCLGGCME